MGYDTAATGGTMVLDSFVRDFGLEGMSDHDRDNTQAKIMSTFQLSAFIGAFATFPIAKKVSRNKAVLLACLVFMLGASLMAGSQGHVGMIVAGWAIGGFDIGSATLTVPVYIAEVAPPSIRGRLVGIFEVTSQTGSLLGFWISYATDRTVDVELAAQWIVPLGLQFVKIRVQVLSLGSRASLSGKTSMVPTC